MTPRGGRRARQKHRAHQAQLRAWAGIWAEIRRARERRPDLGRPASQPGTFRRQEDPAL